MSPREASAAVAAWSCVLLAVLVSADSEIKVYRKLGDDVVLKPGNASVTVAVTTVVWKHNHSLALEFDAEASLGIDKYRQFTERGSLNPTDGEMTLRGLTRNDSGLYTSEVNGVKSPDIRLVVISPVPKPTVAVSCDDESASCTLTCNGDAGDAADTGLVTCRWSWDDATGCTLRITKDASSSVGEFSCELENPVSRESSRPVTNPLSTTPGGKLNVSMGVMVFIALLVGVLLLVGFHRCKAGMWFFQKSSMPWEPNFWRKNEQQPRDAAESNGSPTNEKGQSDEETPFA